MGAVRVVGVGGCWVLEGDLVVSVFLKSFLQAWNGRRSGGMRVTCPNHFRRRFVISSQMVFVMLSLRLISSFLTLSIRRTPRMTRRHLISKVSRRHLSACLRVQVSAP